LFLFSKRRGVLPYSSSSQKVLKRLFLLQRLRQVAVLVVAGCTAVVVESAVWFSLYVGVAVSAAPQDRRWGRLLFVFWYCFFV
jgi:hypothetical protein